MGLYPSGGDPGGEERGAGALERRERSVIRYIKTLLFTAVVPTVFWAVGASGVQAAEFHCAVEPCRVTLKPDGSGKTAHQLWVFRNETGDAFPITCGSISGEATLPTKTAKELTVTNVGYQNCVTAFEWVSIKMNGCHYLFTSAGELSIGCPENEKIEIFIPDFGNCLVTIEAQGPLSGIKYHDAGLPKAELTIETAVKGIKSTIDNKPCGIPSGEYKGEITTGNAILTGETDNEEAKMVNFWWE